MTDSATRKRRLLTQASAVWFHSFPLLTAGSLCLTGCAGAPSLTIAGAYFPAWLLCALVAVAVAVAVRGVMVATGLSNVIPFQLMVCVSFGVMVALLIWRSWMVQP
jgi:cytosine/uracil/thiamine/allantoin permease